MIGLGSDKNPCLKERLVKKITFSELGLAQCNGLVKTLKLDYLLAWYVWRSEAIYEELMISSHSTRTWLAAASVFPKWAHLVSSSSMLKRTWYLLAGIKYEKQVLGVSGKWERWFPLLLPPWQRRQPESDHLFNVWRNFPWFLSHLCHGRPHI